MTLKRRILFVLLGISLLLGQMPYQSLYCRAMKRSIDQEMMRCCMKHHGDSPKRLPKSVSTTKNLQVLEKPTVSVFQQNQYSELATVIVDAVEAPYPSLQCTVLDRSAIAEAQPPDLTILNLNLRI